MSVELAGMCPLDEERSNTPNANQHFCYSDVANGDPDEADYLAQLRYCLAHEWMTDAPLGKVSACRK